MRILVTTPTGHIGSRIVDRLLPSSHDLVLLARDPAKLSDAIRTKATVIQGSLDDTSTMETALTGVDAAFLLIPPPAPSIPHWRNWQEALGQSLATAAAQADVPRTVFLSSTGSQHDDIAAVTGLGVTEKALDAALPNVVSIRAGYFMENFFNSLGTISAQGEIHGVFAPDAPLPVVATHDIGDVAVRWLTDASWTGHHVVASHGPDALTHAQLAAILTNVLERDVNYVQVPAAAYRDALLGAGVPPLIAHGYEELLSGASRHMDAGDYSAEPHTADSSGPTSFETFARDSLLPAYRLQATAAA